MFTVQHIDYAVDQFSTVDYEMITNYTKNRFLNNEILIRQPCHHYW